MPEPAASNEPSGGPTVADVGEDALVRAVVDRLASSDGAHAGPAAVLVGPGDDAAVLTVDGPLVTSTDTLVQGVDFRLDWSSGRDVGRKAVVQVLADVEAMGAVPVGLVLALVVPGRTPLSWCLDLADGCAAEASAAGVTVLGGDVADGGALVLTGTAFGVLEGARPAVLRGGASPGDVVALGPAGAPLGASAAGLAVLQAGRAGPGRTARDGTAGDGTAGDGTAGDGTAVDRVVAVHRAPTVDHTAGARAREAGATAMIDVSDGLVRDATRLARASGVVLDLRAAALQPSHDLVVVGELLGVDPAGWVLTSGEEHAMLACLPTGAALPEGFHEVGLVTPARPDGWTGVTVDGTRRTGAGGWVHYGSGHQDGLG